VFFLRTFCQEEHAFLHTGGIFVKLEQMVSVDGKQLRCGYTTGTCAAGAARCAAEALLTGKFPALVIIHTPSGIPVSLEPENCILSPDFASCAVRKDGGADIDATHGALITATVTKILHGIEIDGGEGVGRVTRPGLDQPVGAAAINSVPRQMITKELEAALEKAGASHGLRAVISVPDGEALAAKTMNGRLGIVGGISILGTSGIVRPMSRQALVDTTRVELNQLYATGVRDLLLVPGNYGTDFSRDQLGLDMSQAAECSNYIGEALDCAAEKGFRSVLLVGHIGKLCKLAAGIFDTHSRTADGRREVFVTHAALCGGSGDLLKALYQCQVTDQCLALLDEADLLTPVMGHMAQAIGENLRRRGGCAQVECLFFSKVYGILGQTEGASELLALHREKGKGKV
jgi:cobalt-precorrin-5B (C1)-methyltransferase